MWSNTESPASKTEVLTADETPMNGKHRLEVTTSHSN